jgi:hypothetical protein
MNEVMVVATPGYLMLVMGSMLTANAVLARWGGAGAWLGSSVMAMLILAYLFGYFG